MIKISHYFSNIDITKGLSVAILLSLFIYIEHLGFLHPIVVTIFGILGFYWLLDSNEKVWFWGGFFISLFWFWWITLSFRIYGITWAIPFGMAGIGLLYGLLFLLLYKISHFIALKSTTPIVLWLAVSIFAISYIHPFGFDWLKLEIVFFNSYLGSNWWQFAIILIAITLAHYRKNLLFLTLIVFAYSPSTTPALLHDTSIKVVTTHISIAQKWDESSMVPIMQEVTESIDKATKEGYKLIIFPESTLTLFLNYEPQYLEQLQNKSNEISIVIGALFWDEGIPRNSTYIFDKGNIAVAHKYILVPFGEYNPLPRWIGDWINKIIYDGGSDYVAHSQMSDYTIGETTYRNAICYEATSEKLYKDSPKHMIAISNNSWFVPSIEPTLQRILMQHYSKKYGTTIYHSINMSPSYIVQKGHVIFVN